MTAIPSPKTIIIIGGYGGVGSVIARLLFDHTDVRIIVAGRDGDKARKLAKELSEGASVDRVESRVVDVSVSTSLEKALRDVDMVIVATTAFGTVRSVAEAALHANVDYLDIYFDQRAADILSPLAETIRAAKRIFITQAGFHPGLPATFIRAGASHVDRYDRAIIFMAMNGRFKKPESTIELIESVRNFHADIFQNGKWRAATYTDVIVTDFGPPFNKRKCFPLQMEEIKAMPAAYGLQATGVYVAGFNWFVDNVVLPLIFILHKIKKGFGTKFLQWLLYVGVNRFSPPREHVTFLLDAYGEKDHAPVHIRLRAEHDDAFLFTAAPVVACVKQYLDGAIATPGLYLMGHVVVPDRLFRDMKPMGVSVHMEEVR